MQGLLQGYTAILRRRPWSTAIATGTIIVSAADITAQRLEGRQKIDKKRLAALALYGGIYSGAAHKFLYASMEKIIPETWNRATRVVSQVMLSQFIHTPFIQLPIYYSWTGLARGYSMNEIEENIHDTFKMTLIRNYQFWLPASAVLYGVVPLHLRVIAMNGASYFWNTGLSVMTQFNVEEPSLELPKDDHAHVHPVAISQHKQSSFGPT